MLQAVNKSCLAPTVSEFDMAVATLIGGGELSALLTSLVLSSEMSEISFRLLSKPFKLLLRKLAFSFQLPVGLKIPDSRKLKLFQISTVKYENVANGNLL